MTDFLSWLIKLLQQYQSQYQHGQICEGRSSAWPKVSKAFLKENASCAACGKSAKETQLIAHHCVPVSVDPSKELLWSNLLPLCESDAHNDHLLFGHLLSWRSYNPNVREDAAAYLEKLKSRP